jgi:hypothetical protein
MVTKVKKIIQLRYFNRQMVTDRPVTGNRFAKVFYPFIAILPVKVVLLQEIF